MTHPFFQKTLKNLIKIGIKKNDNIYLGINLGQSFKFYKNEIFQNNSLNEIRENCAKLIFQTITDYLGSDGTIICPTFSFHFIKTKIFNVKKVKVILDTLKIFF